jgi:hypothetical protein
MMKEQLNKISMNSQNTYYQNSTQPNSQPNSQNSYQLVGGSDATSPDSLGGMVSERINNVVNSFIKAFVHLADSFIPVFSQAALGNLADIPYEDIAPELEKNKQLIKYILDDPVTKKAFQELIKTYVEFLIELYKLNEDEINKLLDTFWEGINEFARRSGTGLSNSALNFIETALAEIPVVGGLIDLAISIMRGFNHFMLATSPVIENSLKGAATAKKMRDDVNSFYNDNVSKLENSLNNLNDVLNKKAQISPQLTLPVPNKQIPTRQFPTRQLTPQISKQQMKGGFVGGLRHRKNKKKNIKKTLKRIHNSISRFTRRR